MRTLFQRLAASLAAVGFTSAASSMQAAGQLEGLLRKAGRTDRRLVVLNKSDLVEPSQLRAAQRQIGPGTLQVCSRNGYGIRRLLKEAVEHLTPRAPRLFSKANRRSTGQLLLATRERDTSWAPSLGALAEAPSLPLIMIVAGALENAMSGTLALSHHDHDGCAWSGNA